MHQPDHSHELEHFWENRWASGHTPWDHGAPAPPFEEFIERHGPPVGEILIPGPGSGHDVRLFAENGARVTGLDISASAVEAASQANPHPNAIYRTGDFLHPSEELQNRFDWVMEHTCLCAMDPARWSLYARAVRTVLRPGGQFLAIFYRNPHDDEGPPFGIDAATIDNLFGDGFVLREAWQPTRSYASRAGREEVRWYQFTG